MAVRILSVRGDGSYFLRDGSLELDGLRTGPPGAVLAGGRGRPVDETVGALLDHPLRSGRRGFDVVVAAPKDLSVLLAIESAAGGRRVVDLHMEAMAGAVAYLRDEGLRTRNPPGHGPSQPVEPIVVGFTHGINRSLDPHLHTHVLVGARDALGNAIDGRHLYRHAAAADAQYLSSLRAGLPDAVDRLSWIGRSGAMRVEGVDPGLVAAMSVPRGRDGRIERAGVKSHPSRTEVTEHWAGLISGAVEFEIPRVPDRPRDLIDEHRFAAALGDGTVSRADVVRAWAHASTFGAGSGAAASAARLLMRGMTDEDRVPAVTLRRGSAVRVLGARPIDLGALSAWAERAGALDRYLLAGHPIEWAVDPRRATPAARIALAPLLQHRTMVRDAAKGLEHPVWRAERGRTIG
jgi:hypothetical protein